MLANEYNPTRGVWQNNTLKLADVEGCRMRSRTEMSLSPETLIMVFVISVGPNLFPNSLLNLSRIFLRNEIFRLSLLVGLSWLQVLFKLLYM